MHHELQCTRVTRRVCSAPMCELSKMKKRQTGTHWISWIFQLFSPQSHFIPSHRFSSPGKKSSMEGDMLADMTEITHSSKDMMQFTQHDDDQ